MLKTPCCFVLVKLSKLRLNLIKNVKNSILLTLITYIPLWSVKIFT